MAQHAEVIVVNAAPVTRTLLSGLPELIGVVRTGIGVDTVDLRAATELGIVVANVPDFCKEEVAEHTLALIFAVARKVTRADLEVRQGKWHDSILKGIQPIYRLSGQTLGLIGMGRIGRAVAQKAQGLGMKVIAFDPYLPPIVAQEVGVPLLNLDELLRQSDIVSLHVPLTPETRHLINARALALMKPQSLVINVSRGPIVDEAALEAALEAGQLGGAGLDVLEEEPPPAFHHLLRFENVVLTSHYASYSTTAYGDLRRQISEQAAEIVRGEFPDHLVNSEVNVQPQCRLVRKRS
jgi:D-3-phosphoglycerate dehydrogenase